MRSSFAQAAFAAGIVTFSLAFAGPAAADVTVFEAPSVADFKLDLYGWVQPRFTVQEKDQRPQINLNPEPAFTVLRARIGTNAMLGPWVTARIEVDYGGDVAKPIDMWVNISPVHEKMGSLNLMAGQFRVPFSRQNLLPSIGYQLPDVAYWIAPAFIVDRNLGVKLWSELFDKRIKLELGMYNGNDPGAGQKVNSGPNFLFAGRLEISPFGPAPAFEGDLRPLGQQHRPILTIGGSAMTVKLDEKQFDRKYVGVDLAAYWQGASLYFEFYYHVDQGYSINVMGTTMPPPCMVPAGKPAGFEPACFRMLGWNLQAGYFVPVPWVREHLELVARVESFDPAMDVTQPNLGSFDLTASNPTQGYMGYIFGLNYFLNHKHTAKAQVSYEIRNELKQCLVGETLPNCHGYVANNLFVAQLTAGF
jgi:hypothetical protein